MLLHFGTFALEIYEQAFHNAVCIAKAHNCYCTKDLSHAFHLFFQNFCHGVKGDASPMWRLLKLNSPEWKALSIGFFGCVCTGVIMPTFAIFYGEIFGVS